jgi:hypothetical protein
MSAVALNALLDCLKWEQQICYDGDDKPFTRTEVSTDKFFGGGGAPSECINYLLGAQQVRRLCLICLITAAVASG